MANCINYKSKDFIELVNQLGLPEGVLAAKIANWQEINGIDNWPTASDLGYNSKFNNSSLPDSNSNIKPGIAELFESNPELANIGTQEQYSQYLDQIFPNSVVKDIVYHGTKHLFDSFSNAELGKTTGSPSATLGHFFTNSEKNAFHYTSAIFYIYPALIDVKRELKKLEDNIKYNENTLNSNKGILANLIESIKKLINILTFSNKSVLSKELQSIEKKLKRLYELRDNSKLFIEKSTSFISKYEKIIGKYAGAFNNSSYLEDLENASDSEIKELTKDLLDLSKYYRKVPFGYDYSSTMDFTVKKVILNIKNANEFSDKYQEYVEKGNKEEFKREDTFFNRIKDSFENDKDGVVIRDSRDPLNADIFVVKDPEQVHILGSKQDIQGFKEFVSNNKELQHKESNNQNVNIIEDLLPAASNNPSVGNPLQNGTRFQAVIDSYIERSKALRDSIARLKVKRKESNDPVEKANLYKRISKLQKAINEIESTDPSNPGLIKKVSQISALENIIPYAEAQLKNVRDILKADKITIEDLKYSEKIVALWIKAGDFSGREHLFWTQSELEDSENNPVLQEALKQFSRLKIEADIIKSTLINPIRENIAKKSVEEQFGKKAIPDLHKAIRDVNWGTMQALDISEVNNPLVQAMHSYLKKANFKAFTEATTISETIDTLIKKIGKVNWDLFKQTFSNTDNRETGNLVYRFSQVFFDERSTILSNARASKNAKARAQAYKKLVKFNADKTIIFDVRKLFPGYWNTTFTQQEIDAHIKELKDTLGEYGYNKFYEKAKENIDKYILDLESQKQIIEDNNTVNGVLNKSAYDIELANWVRENSPAAEAEIYSMSSNDINNMTFTPSGTYSVKVPRRVINGKDTGYYDKKFETIESNEDLRNLYEILFDTINELKAVLPYEDTKWMQINSLPTVYKNILDQYGEDGMAAGLNPLMDALAESSRTSDLSTTDYRYRNLSTGDPDKHIQTSMMIDYNNKIKELVKLKIVEYKLENNSNPSMDQINEFKKDAANKIAQEKSFDLGKVTKMYALMALSYKHKAAIQHIMESLEYTIKNTPEIGVNPADAPLYDKNGNPIKLNGRLSNLSTMLDTFMDYYYGYKMDKPFGKTKSKIYTTEEKEKKDNLEEALELNEKKYSNKEITEAEYNSNKEVLTEMLEMLGGVRTWSKYGDMFLQYVQVKGMGWNIFAGITNMLYGFISNLIEASDGRNYDQESFWKAQSKVLRTVGGNKFTDEAIKIRSLMKKLDILKDSRYELYDSTSQSAFGKFKKKFKALNPYTPQTSTEFINQATVLVAMMIYNKVEVNGSEIPLYDCFDKNGELKEGIALPENFDLADFKIRVDKVIKLNHGNYDPDSPLNLKRQLLGRALSQFRTWSFQGFSERFMGEMYDYQLGMVRKGRYRSYVDFYKTMKDNDVGYIASTFYITKQLLRKASFGVYNTEFGEIQGLSEVDAANMRKNMTELVVLAMLTAVALLLKDLIDKDRKGPKYLAYFYLNQITRLSTDLMFYTSPSQFEKLTRNAMPAFSAVIDLEDAMAKSINYIVDNESDEIKTGVNAHKSKAFRAINKVVPNPYSGLGRVMDAAQTDYSTKPIK